MSKSLFYFLISLFILLLQSNDCLAKFYVGAGPDYVIPQGKLKEENLESLGLNIMLESRNYCRLWYGLRIDYVNFDKADSALVAYYNNAFLLSPEVRYNLVGCDNFLGRLMPYIQGMLTFSSIGGQDKANRLGLGAGLGAGLAYGFEFLDLCWAIDANALYSAPNAILRATDRPSLQSINFSLNLSLGL